MIYIHVPFCRSWCSYCDFYSEIACRGKDSRMISSYLDELLSEISLRSDEILNTLDVNTLYIGGGTPSVLPLGALRSIVERLRELGLGGSDGARANSASDGSCRFARSFEEFTVEVNPDDIVAGGLDYVRGLRALGVNRVSMGVQSWDDGILRWMNRRHDAACAQRAFELLREAGFRNLSIDLIFGLSNLSMTALEASLERTCALRPEHISAYQLSIESGSALGAMHARGEYIEACEDLCSAQYELICSKLSEAGYVHYEISSWALPGFEARHNSAYWTRQAYVGLGPGAHSFDGKRRRSWNSTRLKAWGLALNGVSASDRGDGAVSACGGEAVSACSHGSSCGAEGALSAHEGEAGFELLSEEEIAEERIMLGLRTAKGVLESDCPRDVVERMLRSGELVRVSGMEDVGVGVGVSVGEGGGGGVGSGNGNDSGVGTIVARSGIGAASAVGSGVGSGIGAASAVGSAVGSKIAGGESRVRIPESRFFVSDEIISELV